MPVGHLLKSEKKSGWQRCHKMWLALLQVSLEMGGFCGLNMEMKGRLDGIFFLFVIKPDNVQVIWNHSGKDLGTMW